MERRGDVLMNLTLLTGAALLLRTVQMSFQVWIAGRIGAQGVGLLQLVGTVGMLAGTLAAAGSRVAVLRLTAEECGMRRAMGVRRTIRLGFCYVLLCSALTGTLLWLASGYISRNWLGDLRCALPLRVTALTLPANALSGVYAGYFTAVGRLRGYTVIEFAERGLGCAMTVLLLKRLSPLGLGYSCSAILIGGGVGAGFGLAALAILCRRDMRRLGGQTDAPHGIGRRLLGIALPLGLSDCARSALSTLEHVLIPRGLRLAGGSAEESTAQYGLMHGMAMPVLMYPAAVLFALSDLVIPELAANRISGRHGRNERLMLRLTRFGLMFAVGCSAAMLGMAEELSCSIYGSPEAGEYIRVLAPMLLVLYTDIVVDAMLKGTGEELSCMRFNVISSAVSALLVWQLVPRFAVWGCILSFVLARSLNAFLSAARLVKCSGLRLRLSMLLRPLLCAALAHALSAAVLPFAACTAELAIKLSLFAAGYFALLSLSGALEREDFRMVRRLLRVNEKK